MLLVKTLMRSVAFGLSPFAGMFTMLTHRATPNDTGAVAHDCWRMNQTDLSPQQRFAEPDADIFARASLRYDVHCVRFARKHLLRMIDAADCLDSETAKRFVVRWRQKLQRLENVERRLTAKNIRATGAQRAPKGN